MTTTKKQYITPIEVSECKHTCGYDGKIIYSSVFVTYDGSVFPTKRFFNTNAYNSINALPIDNKAKLGQIEFDPRANKTTVECRFFNSLFRKDSASIQAHLFRARIIAILVAKRRENAK